MASDEINENASAGHKLGQLVGDWFEEYLVLPLLENVAKGLHLYLDHRFHTRDARGDKILWNDEEGNSVDYDFVMELGGKNHTIGIPVAFFECFWRRGSRHSKDKARDDSGKLAPMSSVYPTARFLGIIAAGDFTQPARQLVISRGIDLFYVPKDKIIAAFSSLGIAMDYPDRATEENKQLLSRQFSRSLTNAAKRKAANKLRQLLGKPAIDTYLDRVRGALGATPQEIRFFGRRESSPRTFETIPEATSFLQKPDFDFQNPTETYLYQITYSNGAEFERQVESLEELRALHEQTDMLANHIASF
ncbi:MAG: hypothetical protein GX594_09755 [Pirellulaceae bacterium]|nr:hypothetical protein [Pirellulaceae bacterium]